MVTPLPVSANHPLRIVLFILLVVLVRPAEAAQSTGVPTAVPPGLDRHVEIFFGNDILGGKDFKDDYFKNCCKDMKVLHVAIIRYVLDDLNVHNWVRTINKIYFLI